jgi:hypothetical protein
MRRCHAKKLNCYGDLMVRKLARRRATVGASAEHLAVLRDGEELKPTVAMMRRPRLPVRARKAKASAISSG